MGHSVGEYVAATVAGVFQFRRWSEAHCPARTRLMQQLPCGRRDGFGPGYRSQRCNKLITHPTQQKVGFGAHLMWVLQPSTDQKAWSFPEQLLRLKHIAS